MFILSSYGSSILFCVITMLCWGSWVNTQKLASKNWRFELFYWDYCQGTLLLSLLLALTLGSNGELGRSFLTDLSQGSLPNIISAILGGVIFNIANILFMAAITFAGMAVAFPVGGGIALVLGVIVNYLASPVGNPIPLFIGVGFIVCAILLGARAHRNLTLSRQGTSTRGITLAVIGGILMGSFYRFVAQAISPDFAHPESGKFGPYSAVVLLCVGICASNLVLNPLWMRYPFHGQPLKIKDYFKGTFNSHLMGVLGGAIWCIGTAFSMIAADQAGFAISYGLGQGATLVATLWGIFVWREFKDAPKGTAKLLATMLLAYVAGLGSIIAARMIH